MLRGSAIDAHEKTIPLPGWFFREHFQLKVATGLGNLMSV